MTRFDVRTQLFAICLAGLAGYVDAIGFLKLGGFFVSFMSGNSTRLAVGVVNGFPSVPVAAGLIGGFVLGVMLGTMIGHLAPTRRAFSVLAAVTLLLAASAFLSALQFTPPALFAITLAMGAENTIFAEGGDVRIGLTYMTGTLVKFGQNLLLALLRPNSVRWLPYLFLWCGLVLGAVAGTLAYAALQLQGLWIAAAGAAALTLVVALHGSLTSNST